MYSDNAAKRVHYVRPNGIIIFYEYVKSSENRFWYDGVL